MADKHVPEDDNAAQAMAASLDQYLDSLLRGDARADALSPLDVRMRLIAAQLRMVMGTAGEPDPAFLERLELRVRLQAGRGATVIPDSDLARDREAALSAGGDDRCVLGESRHSR